MRNFLRIAAGLNPTPVLVQLANQPELWNQYKVRTFYAEGKDESVRKLAAASEAPEFLERMSVHRVVDDIVLRYNPFNEGEDFVERICSEIHCEDYPAWAKLLTAHPFVYGLMTQVQGTQLGRVMVTRVPPGVCIPLHTDLIDIASERFPNKVPPAIYYDRYHVVLQSAPGVVFTCGGESVYMAPGEVWWFDNCLDHEVVNGSEVERIHLIIDVHTRHDVFTPRGVR